MEQARGFVNLACPGCEGLLFAPLVWLKHRPGGGLVADPGGWACLNCAKIVNPQEALNAYHVKVKREELRQLEDELGVEHATTGSPLPREDHGER